MVEQWEWYRFVLACFLFFLFATVIWFLEGITLNGGQGWASNKIHQPLGKAFVCTRNKRGKGHNDWGGQEDDSSNFCLLPLHSVTGEIINSFKVPRSILWMEMVVSFLSNLNDQPLIVLYFFFYCFFRINRLDLKGRLFSTVEVATFFCKSHLLSSSSTPVETSQSAPTEPSPQ